MLLFCFITFKAYVFFKSLSSRIIYIIFNPKLYVKLAWILGTYKIIHAQKDE